MTTKTWPPAPKYERLAADLVGKQFSASGMRYEVVRHDGGHLVGYMALNVKGETIGEILTMRRDTAEYLVLAEIAHKRPRTPQAQPDEMGGAA